MTHPRTGYIRSRVTLTPEQLLADIGSRMERCYSARAGESSIADLEALIELCRQQRATIVAWELVCHMRCPGSQGVAELVRCMDECTYVGQEEESMQ